MPVTKRPQIRVVDLCKVYKLYWGPRSLLRELLLAIPSHHQLRALEKVSFDVGPGESFGVVGDNGAGKTTLLKILTGTTFPSSGIVEVQGKLNALLELGAGFHPQFTGRENIYFSGALVGLDRQQIAEQTPEIIEFSELDDFIDNPVKTYSSGMYVRLGFALATGFDPEVLIIDEALAVGDQRFQKKCTDRILDFKKRGKTIFFCSHNLHQVKILCNRTLWLDKGKMMALGAAGETVDRYNEFCRKGPQSAQETHLHPCDSPALQNLQSKLSRQVCWIEKTRLRDRPNRAPAHFRTGDDLQLDIQAYFSPDFQGTPTIGVVILRSDGIPIYTTSSTFDQIKLAETEPNHYQISILFPNIPLLSGGYYFNVITTDHNHLQAYDIQEQVEPFSITSEGLESGVTMLEHHWIVSA